MESPGLGCDPHLCQHLLLLLVRRCRRSGVLICMLLPAELEAIGSLSFSAGIYDSDPEKARR